ncbi:Hypothetical predicted protein, partial [Olea europaea subsp. europaea]
MWEKWVKVLVPSLPATKQSWSLEHYTSDHDLVARSLNNQQPSNLVAEGCQKKWEKWAGVLGRVFKRPNDPGRYNFLPATTIWSLKASTTSNQGNWSLKDSKK